MRTKLGVAFCVVAIIMCLSTSVAKAQDPPPVRDLSGTWTILSNSTGGTLVLTQEVNALPCKQLTGTMSALSVGPVLGIYCPKSRRIYFGRFDDGDTLPFQMYEGYVNATGSTIAGEFFYWGTQPVSKLSGLTSPWFARKQ
jgi:hypothetical protein